MKRFLGRVRNDGGCESPAAEQVDEYRVLWRGYIANRAELLTEARRLSPVPESCSDARLFATAYRRWGAKLQDKVWGEYALALFDERDASLFLTHDALGLIPLFYGVQSEGLLFGSHLEDLVAEAGPGELDEEYLADFLATPYFTGKRTPYQRFSRLLPGHSATWRRGRFVETRSWSLAEIRPLERATDEEYDEQLRDRLSAGVAAALRTDGNVWTECSGGLDSSTVTCLASRCAETSSARAKPAALSVVYSRSRRADETTWIQSVVEPNSLAWHTIDGDECLPFGEVPEQFCAEPHLAMVTSGLYRRYRQLLKAHGVDVLLTGQGGDLVFLGPGLQPFYLADLARRGRLFQLQAELRRWRQADQQHRSLFFWISNYILRPNLRRALRRPMGRVGQPGPSPWFNPEYVRAMRLVERARRSPEHGFTTAGDRWFGENLTTVCALVATLNQSTDAFDFRHPLLYRGLVEFMYAVPWEDKVCPTTDRLLQRRALNGILPDPIRLREDKTNLDQPSYEGLRRGRDWLDMLTKEPRLAARGIVAPDRWREAVNQARMGRTYHLSQFSAATTLEVWLRQIEHPPIKLTLLPRDPKPKVGG